MGLYIHASGCARTMVTRKGGFLSVIRSEFEMNLYSKLQVLFSRLASQLPSVVIVYSLL
jgi:hypothetical protein